MLRHRRPPPRQLPLRLRPRLRGAVGADMAVVALDAVGPLAVLAVVAVFCEGEPGGLDIRISRARELQPV